MEQTITVEEPKAPVQVELLLQISIATLVVLSTLLLSMGQQNLTYAVVALVAATTSFVITDLKGYVQLGQNASSAASLLACVVLVFQIVSKDESQLLNVANILIYLQVILLFQRKEDRTYWSLMALSLLQIIVAAALNLGLLFGVLLAIYVLVAFASLTLFFVHRQTRPFLIARDENTKMAAKSEVANERLVVVDELDPVSKILNRPFVRRMTTMILITALLTIIVFFVIPRYNTTVWQSPQQQTPTTGFTEEVELDDISRILESAEQVMRVEFTSQAGTPYQIDTEPYFRGTALSVYKEGGRWKQFKSERLSRPFVAQNFSPQDQWQVVRQRITLQPGSHSVLFNVAPCFPTTGTPERFLLNLHSRQLTLGEERDTKGSTFRYDLGTTAFRNGWQKDLIPVLRPLSGIYGDPVATVWDRQEWQQFPRITEAAAEYLADQNLTNAGAFERAKSLENHFRISGRYSYSLDVNKKRNRQLDPIEDFVANHRTGHCEYFASALTLMLRSQQIPARMVVGYKGGDLNTVGNYYIVRQLHAHAWVEAYLARDEIPEDEVDPVEDLRYGVWLRLDPTPSGMDVVSSGDRFPMLTTIREFFDYCQVLWDDYILGLNSSRQQQAIYGPLVRNMREVVMTLFSPDAWRERLQQWQQWLRQGKHAYWQSALVIGGIIAGLVLLRKVLWNLMVAIRSLVRRPFEKLARQGPRLDLYDQLERVLAKNGYKRRPQQTPSEFAEVVGGQLAEISPLVHVAGVPRRLAHAHYRVRFGDQTLEPDEHRQLKHALHNFEKAMHGIPSRPRP